jgi:hypothetical protein
VLEISALPDNKFLNNEHFKQNLFNSDDKKNIMKKHLIFWHETVNPPKNVPEHEKKYIVAKKYFPTESSLLGSYASSTEA